MCTDQRHATVWSDLPAFTPISFAFDDINGKKPAELRVERIAPYLPVYNAIVDSSAFALKLTKIDGRYTSMSADCRVRARALNQSRLQEINVFIDLITAFSIVGISSRLGPKRKSR